MTKTLPHRFRERSFRTYELTIAAIVRVFPATATFNPAPYSQETFSARLRDAMRSYKEHNWESGLINRRAFLDIADDIVVGQRDGVVVVGTREGLKTAPPPAPSTEEAEGVKESLTLNVSDINLYTLCMLSAERALCKQIVLVGLSDDYATKLQDAHDIFLVKEGDNYILTL